MRVPLAKSRAPVDAPAAGQAAPCTTCGGRLTVGQDWCLECGTAVPGRLGRGPGLRASLGVVGVTLLLVAGAVAAAYAALSSDSNQATRTIASTPAVVTPAVPDVPVATVPAATTPSPVVTPSVVAPAATTTTTSAPTTTPVAPKLPRATPTPTPAPAPAVTRPVTVAPKPTTSTPTTTPTKKVRTPSASQPAAQSAKILLDTDAASTYNPYGLPDASFGDPAKAIDGDPTTAWTYQLAPASAGKTLVGLAINLKSPQPVRAIAFATATPGMTVEFYGATGTEPVSITDPGWIHLANRRHIKMKTTIDLKTRGKSFRYLLVWITNAPAGVTTGSLGISELSVST